jgi:L-ascorbate 6-phosphate lactonase
VTLVARELTEARPQPGTVMVWALGQAGFALQSAGRLVLVDPWLSESLEPSSGPALQRGIAPPLLPQELEGVDLVCCTHEHPDHLDGPTLSSIADRCGDAHFVVPGPAVDKALSCGLPAERVVGVYVGQSIELSGVEVTPTPAAHELHPEAFGGYRFWLSADGDHRALGYLIEIDNRRLFHAGDTVWYPGIVDELRRLSPDLAFLPINGRDWMREQRDIVGNLTASEAAAIAAEAELAAVAPCHFDGVVGNTADPDEFVYEMQRRKAPASVHVLRSGEAVSV